MRTHTLAALAFAASLALPAIAHAQQQDTTTHVPKGTTVAKRTGAETERVAHRTGKVVKKGAKDTGKQAKRTAKSLKRAVSRKARQEAKSEGTPAQKP
jgi:hypothetical protein